MEKLAKRSRGVLIYSRKAELFQRPIILMVESSIPALAAAVAAPILKLWPAKFSYGRPTACSAALISWVKLAFVSGLLSLNLKNGPAWSPLMAM